MGHRLTCGLEDAGWEIRDQLMWLRGQGFPKSRNLGRGRGTALKPGWEPSCSRANRSPASLVENVAAHGTGGLNIDAPASPSTARGRSSSRATGRRRRPKATAAGSAEAPSAPATRRRDGGPRTCCSTRKRPRCSTSGPASSGAARATGSRARTESRTFGRYGRNVIRPRPSTPTSAAPRGSSTARRRRAPSAAKGNTHPTVKPLAR